MKIYTVAGIHTEVDPSSCSQIGLTSLLFYNLVGSLTNFPQLTAHVFPVSCRCNSCKVCLPCLDSCTFKTDEPVGKDGYMSPAPHNTMFITIALTALAKA